jgi:cytochrome c556
MFRTWARLSITAGTVASVLLAVAATRAQDDDEAKSPLARIMKKIDTETRAIKAATATNKSFKESGKSKAVVASARVLIDLGKQARKFEEPSKKMNKPFDKWTDLTDRYITAAGELIPVAEKGDINATRKAYTSLNNTCSNCHGAFRPSVDDGF